MLLSSVSSSTLRDVSRLPNLKTAAVMVQGLFLFLANGGLNNILHRGKTSPQMTFRGFLLITLGLTACTAKWSSLGGFLHNTMKNRTVSKSAIGVIFGDLFGEIVFINLRDERRNCVVIWHTITS